MAAMAKTFASPITSREAGAGKIAKGNYRSTHGHFSPKEVCPLNDWWAET